MAVPAIAGSIALVGASVLEGLGLSEAVGGAVATITGSEALGTFAGGATVAKSAQKIEEMAESGINTLIDATVSEETQQSVYDMFGDFKAAYSAFQSQDPSIYVKRQQEKALEMRIENDDGEITGNSKSNPNFNKNAVLPYGSNPLVLNSDIDPSVHYVDRYNNNGDNVISANQNLKDIGTRNISASELARFIVGYSTDLSFSKDPDQSVKNFVQKNPSQLDTVERINNFLADKALPTSAEFKEIYEKYNGKSIDENSFKYYRDSEGLFHVVMTDELGQQFDMPENTGYVLPAVPGYTFVGPFSKNDRPPTNSVVDYFAVFHDYSYRNGINRRGDMQFVSRLSQNKDRMRPDEINFANSTIIYFSTMSLALGSFFGSQNPEDVSKGPVDNLIKDDIFVTMQPSANELPAQEYQNARYKFYDEFEKSLLEESVTSSTMAQLASSAIGDYYLEEFGEIQIQLI